MEEIVNSDRPNRISDNGNYGKHVRNDLPAPARRVSTISVSRENTHPVAKHQL
jgi:hypothetical protein